MKRDLIPSSERDLLLRMDAKIDTVISGLEHAQRRAAIAGVVAGGISGSVAGGMMTLGIAYIKAKLGL